MYVYTDITDADMPSYIRVLQRSHAVTKNVHINATLDRPIYLPFKYTGKNHSNLWLNDNKARGGGG
jgi:hypothetical protein